MSYCINPLCPQPDDLANAENLVCRHCGSALLLRDRYRVVKLLSDDSGFAAIYEVSDGTTLKILKVLKSHHNKNLRAVELFRQEAVILSQLRHPGIPKVEANAYFTYTAHSHPELVHCFVMEKIEGMNLQQWLQQQSQPIPQTQALLWLQQITKILQVVHKQNYFHRDIKLQNIMLRPTGQLVLIDFGAAREMTYTYLAQIGSAGTITRISSAGYTPPEQDKGHAVPQSDFYALGRTFVYLLTGKKLGDVYDPLTDEFKWRDHTPQISPPFANFIDRLMSPKAIDRPKDTQEILATLEHLLAGHSDLPASYYRDSRDQATTLMPKTTVLQKDKTEKNIAKRWLIGSGIAVLLVASGSYWAWSNFQTHSPVVVTQPWESDRIFKGHEGNINDIVITADQKRLISASADKTIKIWNLNTGELLQTLTGHNSFINDVAISPDGQVLASGSADKAIKIWNLNTGELLQTLTGHNSSINYLVFSPDGQHLYSASADTTIRVWDLNQSEAEQVLSGHESSINALAVRPDGQVLISAGADKMIKFWDLESGEEIKSLTGHQSYINDLVMSPDGEVLVSASADDTIKVWDADTGEKQQTLIGHTSFVNALAISLDGKTLVSSGADKTIRFWNLDTGEVKRILTEYPRPIDFFAMTSDSEIIATGSQDTVIRIWQEP